MPARGISVVAAARPVVQTNSWWNARNHDKEVHRRSARCEGARAHPGLVRVAVRARSANHDGRAPQPQSATGAAAEQRADERTDRGAVIAVRGGKARMRRRVGHTARPGAGRRNTGHTGANGGQCKPQTHLGANLGSSLATFFFGWPGGTTSLVTGTCMGCQCGWSVATLGSGSTDDIFARPGC